MTAYSRILCPVDFSDFSRRALRYAAATAKWYGARLTVLHVYPEMPVTNIIPSLTLAGPATGVPERDDRTRVMELLSGFVHDNVPAGVASELLMQDERNAAEEISSEASALHSDLIVMGSHGRIGYERLLLGSVTERVVRRSPCSVIVVPSHATAEVPPGDAKFDSVLCAVDFSESAFDAVAAALVLAQDADARLTLLNVLDMPRAAHERADRVQETALAFRATETASRLRHLGQLVPESAHIYCRIETVVGEGQPSREILRVAAERASDLIVLGVRARGALDRLIFGSTMHEVLQEASCPVLIVHEA